MQDEELDYEIDKLIDECINALVNDNASIAAEALASLAVFFAKAGMQMKAFLDIRKFIVDQAIEKTSALFISEKLLIAERITRESRTQTRIILH